MQAFGFGFLFVAMYYVIIFGISITMYLLQSIGIYKMGKNMGLSNPWISFIPVANVYAIGRIAEKYIKLDGKPSAKFSKILLTLYIIMSALMIAFLVLIVAFILVEAMGSPSIDAFLNSDAVAASLGVTFVLPLILFMFGFIGLAFAFSIVYYIAIWRIFALYEPDNATLYLVLSLFFNFLLPIFIFILRNRQPQIMTYQQPENIM